MQFSRKKQGVLLLLNMAHTRQHLKRKNKGVPLGYFESWNYQGRWNEKPIKRLPNGRKVWKIRFKATKRRPAQSWGGFGKGTRGRWKIIAIQDIIKTGKGTYKTDMKGYKTPVYFHVKKPRQQRIYYKNYHRKNQKKRYYS